MIDIAHPPRDPDHVEDELLDALRKVQNSSKYRVLKIIHGYGSRGSGGSTRTTVRNWLFRRSGLLGVIEGEQFAVLDQETRRMLDETGLRTDPDLGKENRGITIVWVK